MGDAGSSLLKTAMPPLSNDAEFFPGIAKKWGLSFMINNGGADRAPGRQPGLGRAGQHLLLDRPEQGIGGVYVTQVLPFADKKALPLFYAFEKAVYDS